MLGGAVLQVPVNPFTTKLKKYICPTLKNVQVRQWELVVWSSFIWISWVKGLKGHFDQNPANPKFDLYYSKRKIGIQLADFPKVTPFTRKTPEIHRVEDAKNARPPCWPWIQSSGQRFHAVTSSYQHDAASHSFLCKMSSSESDLSSSISSESSFLSIHDPLGDVENVDSSVGGSTTVFDDSCEGLLRTAHIEQVIAIEEQESSEFMKRLTDKLMKP